MAMGVIDWATFGLIVGIVAVGLFVGYQAYRGFRRHDSRPMRLLSVGLILLTAVAPVIAFGSWVAISWYGLLPRELFNPIALTYRFFQFVGLCLIAYSLYERPS